MYLKRIKITNFRTFGADGIETEFSKGVNAIIGENNTGKSSIIDAVRIAFSTIYYHKDIYFVKADFHVDLSGNVAKFAQFDVYLEDVPKRLIEIWNPKSVSDGEFHIRFYTEKTPAGLDKVKYSAWGGEVEGNTLTSNTFDAIDMSYLNALRDAETGMKPSRTSKLSNLLSNVASTPERRETLVSVLRNANNSLIEKEEIVRLKEIINHNLGNIEQEILSQHIDVGLIEPSFDSIGASMHAWLQPKWVLLLNDNPVYDEVLKIVEDSKLNRTMQITTNGIHLNISAFLQSVRDIPISDDLKNTLAILSQRCFELKQNGLGYNNIIYMATILGDMSIKKSGIYQSLLLVEEPEAHLHPQLQELVHNFFVEQHNRQKDIQVIYTSHSPTLVSKIGIENINLLFERNHKIECTAVIKDALDDTDRIYLTKYLDVTKSQLFFAKGLIFVEGISEFLLIHEIADFLNRPLDKYAVEVINVGSLAFKPFAKLLYKKEDQRGFAKAAIITDNDKCTNKSDVNTYISKDLDFDDDIDDIANRLKAGTPSSRFEQINDLCKDTDILLCGAVKTLEYELAFCESNVNLLMKIIISLYPQVGLKLKEKLDTLDSIEKKQICIWIFIRNRDSSKGEIAQALCKVINDQKKSISKGENVENLFQVPVYIQGAIFYVTEPMEEGE